MSNILDMIIIGNEMEKCKMLHSTLSCTTRQTVANYNKYFIDDGEYAIVHQECVTGGLLKTIKTIILNRKQKPYVMILESLNLKITWDGYNILKEELTA